jgi:hypothetical protein
LSFAQYDPEIGVTAIAAFIATSGLDVHVRFCRKFNSYVPFMGPLRHKCGCTRRRET